MLRRPRSYWLFVTFFVLSCASLGCARIERARECKQLAETVNARLDEVERLAPRAAPSGSSTTDMLDAGVRRVPGAAHAADREGGAAASKAERYRRMAQLYLGLSREVASVDVADERLVKQIENYSRLMKRTARALDRLAEASQAGNHRGIRAATTELQTLQERQRTASQQIDQLCLSP